MAGQYLDALNQKMHEQMPTIDASEILGLPTVHKMPFRIPVMTQVVVELFTKVLKHWLNKVTCLLLIKRIIKQQSQ